MSEQDLAKLKLMKKPREYAYLTKVLFRRKEKGMGKGREVVK